jgi:hypothetical protein
MRPELLASPIALERVPAIPDAQSSGGLRRNGASIDARYHALDQHIVAKPNLNPA